MAKTYIATVKLEIIQNNLFGGSSYTYKDVAKYIGTKSEINLNISKAF